MIKKIITLLGLITFAFSALAERSQNVRAMSYNSAIVKASSSVVSLYATKNVSKLVDNVDAALYGKPVKTTQENSLGSGVFVSNDGLILTNSHIVENSKDIKVVTTDEKSYVATVIDIDKGLDIAFLKIIKTEDKFNKVEFADSDDIMIGDVVFAIGNPFGIGQSASMGIVSAIGRAFNIENAEYLIQTDAAINPGNSGGALINVDGKLIGLNSAIFSKTQTFSGIGFAVPSNALKFALDTVLTTGSVKRAWLGAKGENITSNIQKALNLKSNNGIYLTHITNDSPADIAGFKAGDILLSLGQVDINNTKSLDVALKTLSVNKRMYAKLVRNGKFTDVEVTLKAIERRQEKDKFLIRGNNLLSGTVVEQLSPELNYMLGMPLDNKGVAIIEMPQKLANNNVQVGDIILELNKEHVKTVHDLTSMLQQDMPFGIKLKILRNGRQITILIK